VGPRNRSPRRPGPDSAPTRGCAQLALAGQPQSSMLQQPGLLSPQGAASEIHPADRRHVAGPPATRRLTNKAVEKVEACARLISGRLTAAEYHCCLGGQCSQQGSKKGDLAEHSPRWATSKQHGAPLSIAVMNRAGPGRLVFRSRISRRFGPAAG